MKTMFDKTQINGMQLKNRFIRSATWEGMAEEDGACTRKLIGLMTRLAAGGVGMIVTGHAYIQKIGQAGPWQLGVYDDQFIPGLRLMTDSVHHKGGAIVAQLAHAGMFADPRLIGQSPLAPSDISGFSSTTAKEMTPLEIKAVIKAFGAASVRAKEAGFDGIQLHSAHGYLLNQFLSPLFNKRKDKYGGALQNRVRLLLDIVREIRFRIGASFPVLVKMNSQDYLEGGLSLEDSLEASVMLQNEGIDALELSGGTGASGKLRPVRMDIDSEEDEAYFKDAAKRFKERLQIPLILVGGIRSFHVAERIIKEETADYIAMSRPFIREPDLINRWQSGDYMKARCISDNKCFIPIRNGKGVYCMVEKEIRAKRKARPRKQ
jgi:2,4-dienoyl-CoA reductase-like NADH-dependent reductase (Old Yellow Enzyme family)